MAARRADHLAHCADCRALSDTLDRQAAENAASMARRDRRQLDLPFSRHTRQVSV
jgi:predicted anti-sigma-YlaC factor YlaD